MSLKQALRYFQILGGFKSRSFSVCETKYHLQVYEDAVPGTYLFSVEATSPTSVWYEIQGDPNSLALHLFSLNRLTGSIYLQKPLDFENEEMKYLNFTVAAMTPGLTGNSTLTFVSIQVLDTNDNAPVFEKQVYYATIYEGRPKGSIVWVII